MAVSISFPTQNAMVQGNGGFFAWGMVTSDDKVNQAYVQWTAAKATAKVNGTVISPPDPCNWAFAFADVAVGPTITLYVEAQSGTVSVPFQCSASYGG
jgi:hypothetical protein